MRRGVSLGTRSAADANGRVGPRGPEQEDRLAEQLGAQASSLERPAEPDDEREQGQARTCRGRSSPELNLGAEGREADEASRAGRVLPRHKRAMPLELEEVLGTDGEAPAPTPEELPADAELARHLVSGSALVLDRDYGAEDELHRMNLSREGVAGQDALPPPASLAASQYDGEPAVAAVQGREAASHPARGELDPRATAATAVAPAQQILRCRGDGNGVGATLDVRYVNHVLLDDLAEPV